MVSCTSRSTPVPGPDCVLRQGGALPLEEAALILPVARTAKSVPAVQEDPGGPGCVLAACLRIQTRRHTHTRVTPTRREVSVESPSAQTTKPEGERVLGRFLGTGLPLQGIS